MENVIPDLRDGREGVRAFFEPGSNVLILDIVEMLPYRPSDTAGRLPGKGASVQ